MLWTLFSQNASSWFFASLDSCLVWIPHMICFIIMLIVKCWQVLIKWIVKLVGWTCAIKAFWLFVKCMHSFGCLHLNQYHQEFPSKPYWNGVGWIQMKISTLNLNCYNDIDSSHFCMFSVQAITLSSSLVTALGGPTFLELVLPSKWLVSDDNGTCSNVC
jgi:hypothetical protein